MPVKVLLPSNWVETRNNVSPSVARKVLFELLSTKISLPVDHLSLAVVLQTGVAAVGLADLQITIFVARLMASIRANIKSPRKSLDWVAIRLFCMKEVMDGPAIMAKIPAMAKVIISSMSVKPSCFRHLVTNGSFKPMNGINSGLSCPTNGAI